ncbi:MAG: helix-turn-helix transcriptional regulator [Chloroflexi bacterium]|nr:helix-turn-helix transcriptional regulator [Chloroflexota bacterium]
MKTRLFEEYVDTKKMTMQALAKRLGYTPQYLSLIRHGHFPITGNFIVRVCLTLGRNIGDLFFEDVPEESGSLHGGDGDERA